MEFFKKVKSHFISASWEGQTEIIVSQMYSKSVHERKNEALKLRIKLEGLC